MRSAGLSKPRLDRMHDTLAGYVRRGEIPGIVTLIRRRGEVYVDTIGARALGQTPMRRDSIFRISSMTKPITAAATMILLEECKLRLDEPVERLLPELADRKVLTRLDAELGDTVPAARSITVRDLLTFRMGFGIILGSGERPIQRAVRESGVMSLGLPKPATPHTPDEWMRRFGALPLMHQPGETWMYNTGSYVLSVLVARASGQPFETFLRERIFEPLGMKDTAFTVPLQKRERLVTSYRVDGPSHRLELYDEGDERSQWCRPPAFPDGAAGLTSTVDDYLAFGQMMLEKGKLGKERILSRASIDVMTTDQLTAAQKASSGFFPGYWDHRGWGFGLSVVTGRDDIAAAPGRFGWDGGLGTTWSTDPAEDMVAIMMTQRAEFPAASAAYLDFWTSVYQAIDD